MMSLVFAVLCLVAVRALATEHLLPFKRAADVSQTGIAPEKDITLYYQAASQPLTAATVDAQMKLPTVVLEEITTISSVSCSAEAVEVVFASTADYQRSVSAWPSSSFILLTNHLGNCASKLLYQYSVLHLDCLRCHHRRHHHVPADAGHMAAEPVPGTQVCHQRYILSTHPRTGC